MGNINYFCGIVKVLETPKHYFGTKQTSVTIFQAEIQQNHKNIIVIVMVWGHLSSKIKNFYKQNDYILIEGYISLRNKRKLIMSLKTLKQITITALRIYPILLNSNPSVLTL